MVEKVPTLPKIALVMVGLPARGKSYIARKLARYLSWAGHETRVFNVGTYRRNLSGAHKSHEFFDPENPEASEERWRLAMHALDDMLTWTEQGGQIAIYDATNTTKKRRAVLRTRCEERGLRVAFIEIICDDPEIIQRNVRETKLHSPDYAGVSPDEAARDFQERILHYERVYETVEDAEGKYIKLVDGGARGPKIVMSGIEGNILSRAIFFLMNLKQKTHPIYLVRHGESVFNVEDRIGGDADLSPRGRAFAQELARFMEDRRPSHEPLLVWTSSLRRTLQTAASLPEAPRPFRALDEIDAGVCEGLTYTEVKRAFPDEFRLRRENKLEYRYPQGESYLDLITRLDRMIIEIERHDAPILIIGHQGVLRGLYAYLCDVPPRECPHLPMPLHTVFEITPNAYGAAETRHELMPTVLRSVPPPSSTADDFGVIEDKRPRIE